MKSQIPTLLHARNAFRRSAITNAVLVSAMLAIAGIVFAPSVAQAQEERGDYAWKLFVVDDNSVVVEGTTNSSADGRGQVQVARGCAALVQLRGVSSSVAATARSDGSPLLRNLHRVDVIA
jgi:hypothetical protein